MKRQDLLGLLAAATALPSCTRVGTGAGAGGGTTPHVLRYTDGGNIESLNPMITTTASTAWLSSLWAAWLFRYDNDLLPVPELATTVPTVANGLLSADGTRIVFTLREAQWSDGTPFTARDVAFTIRRVLDPHTNVVSRDGWDQIARVETPDDRTVILHMKRFYAAFLPTFFTTGGANACVLPEHICKDQDANDGAYNALPVGIGPFKIDAWHRGTEVALSANPRYWRGAPKLRKVVYRILQEQNTIETQARTGELDLWIRVPSRRAGYLADAPRAHLVRRSSTIWSHLDCNCAHPALADANVRRALDHAIDRKTILEKIDHGIGSLRAGVIAANLPFAEPHVATYAYDLAAARALLDGAGWRPGARGVRAKDGVPLDLTLVYGSGSPQADRVVDVLRQNFQRIGVALRTKTYPTNLLFGGFANGGIINTGKFDLALFSWVDTPAPTDIVGLYAADRTPPAGQNTLFWKNAEVTRILHEATSTIDVGKRTALLRRAQIVIAAQAPTIPLIQNEMLYLATDGLSGWNPTLNSPFDFMMDADVT